MAQKLEFKVGLFITITTVLIVAAMGYVFYQDFVNPIVLP